MLGGIDSIQTKTGKKKLTLLAGACAKALPCQRSDMYERE